MKYFETIDEQEMSTIIGGHWAVGYDENGNPYLYWMPDDEEPDDEGPFAWVIPVSD